MKLDENIRGLNEQNMKLVDLWAELKMVTITNSGPKLKWDWIKHQEQKWEMGDLSGKIKISH